jgi:GAF domain-containing protein
MPDAHHEPCSPSLGERYRVLLGIGHTLARTLTPHELYRSIYRETAKVLEASGFYIALYDGEKDLATVVFYADRGSEQSVEITYRGSESEVLRTGKGNLVEDRLETRSLMVLGEAGTELTRSAITVPLIYEGEVMGSISSQSYQPGAFHGEDMELLQGIADLAAVAIINARHVTELEARRRELERLEEIGRAITSSLDTKEVLRNVMDAVLELLQADASAVWLLEDGHAGSPLPGAGSGFPRAPRGPLPKPSMKPWWWIADPSSWRISPVASSFRRTSMGRPRRDQPSWCPSSLRGR